MSVSAPMLVYECRHCGREGLLQREPDPGRPGAWLLIFPVCGFEATTGRHSTGPCLAKTSDDWKVSAK